MKKLLLAGLAIFFGLFLVNTRVARADMGSTDGLLQNTNNQFKGGHMMGFNGGMMAGFGIFAILTWIAFISFLLAGVYFFIKRANKK